MAEKSKSQPVRRLFWVDMEMTGLEVEHEVIIEVAAVVTDLNLHALDSYHSVVKQPAKYLEQMDDWNREHHGRSGLTALVPNGREPERVEQDLLDMVARNFESGERPILAGNSIAQDRLFVQKYMPRFAQKLHYRMLDVTAWKIIFNNLYKIEFAKDDAVHRAVEDVHQSINEFAFYLRHLQVIPPQ